MPPDPNATSLVSDEDLQRIGHGIIRDFVSAATQLVFYGVYVVTICASALILLRRRPRSRGSMLLLFTMIIMFLISTFLWTSTAAAIIQRVNVTLVDTSLGDLQERLRLANTSTETLRSVGGIMYYVNCVIGDALLTWRVTTIYQRSLAVMVLLGSTWLGVAANVLGYTICLSKARFPLEADTPAICVKLSIGGMATSALLNGLAVALLFRIAWNHRSAIRETVGVRAAAKSKVNRVLTVLVVSGTLYLIFFILGNVGPDFLPASTPTTLLLTEIGNQAYYQLTGIYPNAVTVFATYEDRIFGNATTVHPGLETAGSLRFRRSETHRGEGRDVQLELRLSQSSSSLRPPVAQKLHPDSSTDLPKSSFQLVPEVQSTSY